MARRRMARRRGRGCAALRATTGVAAIRCTLPRGWQAGRAAVERVAAIIAACLNWRPLARSLAGQAARGRRRGRLGMVELCAHRQRGPMCMNGSEVDGLHGSHLQRSPGPCYAFAPAIEAIGDLCLQRQSRSSDHKALPAQEALCAHLQPPAALPMACQSALRGAAPAAGARHWSGGRRRVLATSRQEPPVRCAWWSHMPVGQGAASLRQLAAPGRRRRHRFLVLAPPHPASRLCPAARRRRTLDAALLGLPALLLVPEGAAAAPAAPHTAAARSISGGEQPGTPAPADEPAPGSAGGRTGGRSTEGSEVPGVRGRGIMRCNLAALLGRLRHRGALGDPAPSPAAAPSHRLCRLAVVAC